MVGTGTAHWRGAVAILDSVVLAYVYGQGYTGQPGQATHYTLYYSHPLQQLAATKTGSQLTTPLRLAPTVWLPPASVYITLQQLMLTNRNLTGRAPLPLC